MSESKKRWPLVLVLLVLCAAIAIVPLVALSDAEFGGADDEGAELIEEIAPGYEPWAEPLFELPDETESLLFCLQAGLGGIVLGYGFGYLRSRKKYRTAEQ